MHGRQIGNPKNETLEMGKDISDISVATISTSSMTKATNKNHQYSLKAILYD